MANNGDRQSNGIPPNTRSVLFAEDMVNYVLQKYSLSVIRFSTQQQREYGVRIFNNNFRIVVDCTYNTFGSETEQTFNFIMANDLYNLAWFGYYAYNVKERFSECPPPEGFLHYSIHLAHLAAKLCAHGCNEATNFAVDNIVAMMELDSFVSKTTILHAFAEIFANIQPLSIDKVEQPPPYRNDEFFAQMIKSQNCLPHVHRCINYGDIFKDTTTLFSSCNFSSFLELQKVRKFVFEFYNRNPYNVSSWDSIGIPGSSRAEPTNLYSQAHYCADSEEEENRQRKRPRLDHGI